MNLKKEVLNGSRDGPHLLVSAGVHGDEFEPMVAVRQLMQQLPDYDLAGRVTLVPVVNESAFSIGERTGADGLDLAREDIGRAMILEPDNLEGLLERGILRRLDGDKAGARDDWLQVVTLAPDSTAAKTARANLQKLDVKLE